MGLLDSFDIFEFLGFGEATGLELLFAASALVGGILFVLWFALMMIGGVAADIFEGLLGMEGVDEDHEVYTLISLEGWVASVKVTRLQEAPWVWADARVGPYPDEPDSMSQAAKVQASFMKWMSNYGRMKRIPPIN